MSGIRISKPVIAAESACVAGVDSSHAKRLAGAVNPKTGLIPVRMEHDVMIQRVSRDLYTGPLSGIRELYANEARACRTAKKEHGASPEIHISINEQTRQLVIHGVDSMGISQERFLEVVSVLGRSDNFDGEESGQFGMGFASYMTISDVCIVETYSRETGEKYGVMGKGGLGFEILDAPADLDSYGTRITMTMRSDAVVKPLEWRIGHCAALSGVATSITVTGASGNIRSDMCTQPSSVLEMARPSGRAPANSRLELLQLLHMSDDLIEVATNAGRHVSSVASFLARMPINYTYAGAFEHIAGDMVVHVKDERRFRPLPNRDGFPADTGMRIDRHIDSMITEKLSSMAAPSFREHINRPENCILDLAVDQGIDIPGHNRRYSEIVLCEGGVVDGTSCRLGDLMDRGGHQWRLLLAKNPSRSKIDAVYKHAPDVRVFRPDDAGIVDDPLIAGSGIETIDGYIRRHGLKPSTSGGRRIVMYSMMGAKLCDKYERDVDDGVICVTNDEMKMLSSIWESHYTRYPHSSHRFDYFRKTPFFDASYGEKYRMCVRNSPPPRAITLDAFRRMCGRILYNTSLGVMSGWDIAQTGLEVVVLDEVSLEECGDLRIPDGKILVDLGSHPLELCVAAGRLLDRLCVDDLADGSPPLLKRMWGDAMDGGSVTRHMLSVSDAYESISNADIREAYAAILDAKNNHVAIGNILAGLDRKLSSASSSSS